MTQREPERELVRKTGETVGTIRSRGFSLVELPDSEPQIVDWDELEAERLGIFPGSSCTAYAA
jgi:hypothetical protein